MTQITFDPSPTGEVPLSAASGAGSMGTGRPKQGRRWVRWFWAMVGWPLVLGVLGVIVLRWQSPERSLVIALVGLTPFFAVPLAMGVFSAWFSRSNTLRAMAGVVTAAFLFTTSPVDAVIGCRAATAPDAMTIYTANVLANGGRPADVAASVVAADADVVLMQEVGWNFLTDLQAQPALADYQYWSTDTEGIPHSDLIWSRWPLEDVRIDQQRVGETISATVVSPNGRFRTTVVHAQAPVGDTNAWFWHQQLGQLARHDVSSPAVMGGDFNATSDHQPFRNLVNAGWTDVHDEKGCGLDTTWPVGQGGLPVPVYRLDHILVTDHFEVLDVQLGDPAGSDHLPVISSIRLT